MAIRKVVFTCWPRLTRLASAFTRAARRSSMFSPRSFRPLSVASSVKADDAVNTEFHAYPRGLCLLDARLRGHDDRDERIDRHDSVAPHDQRIDLGFSNRRIILQRQLR